jgi:SIR2-like domain
LESLLVALKPEETTLLLGAGASVPSGAPSGAQLAHKLWREVARTEPQSEDLMETASILERRFTRPSVIGVVISTLKKLKPTGGILGLPQFGWSEVCSTNFDQLVEHAYKTCAVPLTVIRSNYDFSYKETRIGTCLYKMHGCITQDRSLGHKASMILTEQDYEDFSHYRQSMFSLLQTAMLTGDILVVGQSLRDRHLNDLAKRILQIKQRGSPGQVYILICDRDDLRAPLLEDRGAKIAFGGMDEFIHALAEEFVPQSEKKDLAEESLPLSVISTVNDAANLKTAEPNVVRMFNGGPATFADIEAGATFERAALGLALERLAGKSFHVIAIIGAAGVGKTTFGRQLLKALSDNGCGAYEHRNDFTFESQPWVAIEANLKMRGKRAFLLLDECTRYLRQANSLIEHLGALENPALGVILTANAAQWAPRIKAASVFSKGSVIELSRLDDTEL